MATLRKVAQDPIGHVTESSCPQGLLCPLRRSRGSFPSSWRSGPQGSPFPTNRIWEVRGWEFKSHLQPLQPPLPDALKGLSVQETWRAWLSPQTQILLQYPPDQAVGLLP